MKGQDIFLYIPNRKKKMEQQFFENEFEQFLKETADQHRMYPSDGVWTNIYRHLHAGRRRIALAGMLLLVAGGLFWLTGNPPIAKAPSFNNAVHLPGNVSPATKVSTVTVADIIAKLRAKSLIPPLHIDAPAKLSPLGFNQKYFPTLADALPVLYPEQSTAVRVNQETKSAIREVSEEIYTSKAINSFSSPQQVLDLTVAPATPQPVMLVNKAPEMPPPATTINVRPHRKGRLSVMMSFAPSIGYRNLFDGNKKYGYSNTPLMTQHLNVNEFVDHQPGIGFEMGGLLRYELTKAITIRTGLQLNLTRYTIQAFAHAPEKTTLALSNSYGWQGDTMVVYSNIRNFAGNRPERLQNQYLQVAIPIGAELKLFGYSKFQVNIAGSIQPSYLLNTNQYLLSNNFSNYVKEPSLIRRWNVATSMEAFFSYQSGDIRWQLGPQFRYNLLSTYKKQYPIRENLMEYGLKIGVSKTLR